MKSKNSKADLNLSILLEKLSTGTKLSIIDIMNLLHCNRQSAYNYIKRLEKNNYTLQKSYKKNSVEYSLSSDKFKKDLLYQPLTTDILRKYTIVQELQHGPIPKENLRKKFTVYKSNELPDATDKTLLDIKLTQYYNLLHELLISGEIELDLQEQTYHLTGKNIPIQMNLDFNELFDLNIALSTISKGSVHYEYLNNIYQKTNLLLGNIDAENPYYNNYLYYGKKISNPEQTNTQLDILKKFDYKNKVLQISYTNKRGTPVTTIIAIGKIVYSVDKDTFYLLGENYSSKNSTSEIFHTIIDISSITDIKETTIPNNCFNSKFYTELLEYMFSISIEPPTDVIVEFDNVANIERKLRYLSCQRRYASIEVSSKTIIYKDKISGLTDFAMYLRKFGKCVHVIKPAKLQEMMMYSINRTLSRYKEETTNGKL